VRVFLFLTPQAGRVLMGTTTMPEHGGGAWWSYPIYAAGILAGTMSPEQWLMGLSILAVLVRLGIDVPALASRHARLFERIMKWWTGR